MSVGGLIAVVAVEVLAIVAVLVILTHPLRVHKKRLRAFRVRPIPASLLD